MFVGRILIINLNVSEIPLGNVPIICISCYPILNKSEVSTLNFIEIGS